eukprot:364212-Chlamydomonas_euryale.AAC.7
MDGKAADKISPAFDRENIRGVGSGWGRQRGELLGGVFVRAADHTSMPTITSPRMMSPKMSRCVGRRPAAAAGLPAGTSSTSTPLAPAWRSTCAVGADGVGCESGTLPPRGCRRGPRATAPAGMPRTRDF